MINEQGTEGWRQDRAGKISASRFDDVIAVTRAGKSTAARAKYMRLLAFERMSGAPVHEIHSKSMDWGSELEVFAREAYELETGNFVTQSGFIIHPTHDFIGCSPDGLIGNDGGYESKCPHDEAVHINTWLEGMPADHIAQVQGGMFVTGRKWWDFISYDPRQRDSHRLFIQRIPRDDAYIATLEKGLLQFEMELRDMIATLESRAA